MDPNLVMTITMSPAGQVEVTGPIANKMVCYAMLELAKDAIRNFEPQDTPRVQPIHGQFNPLHKGNGS